jgi:protein-tyrosine phosphatase
MTRDMKKSVLFVCLGNICRSPTGEGVCKKLASERGLDGTLRIDSAGTSGWHIGEPADERMRQAAANRGYDLDSLGRKFVRSDFEEFDLIIAMDRENRRDILSLDPDGKYAHKVKLLCDYLPNSPVSDVPDPYYGGRQGFETVLDMIEEACEGILDELTGK